MVQGGMSIVKYVLFAFNLIFVIFGILLIWSAISTSVTLNHWHIIVKSGPNASAIALAIFGFSIFFVAFLGCCGAVKENHCMLVTFGTVITILLVIEIILAGVILSSKVSIEDQVRKELNATIYNYNFTNKTPQSEAIDDVQHFFTCCGVDKPDDWLHNQFVAQSKTEYPWSCCPAENIQGKNATFEGYCDKKVIFKDGCIGKFYNSIRGSLNVVGGIAIAIALIQFLGIVFSCCLARTIKKEYEVV